MTWSCEMIKQHPEILGVSTAFHYFWKIIIKDQLIFIMEIDWKNIGFGYFKTDYKFKSYFKKCKMQWVGSFLIWI